ncbi:MAG: CHAP domain-containing protein [Candidatus Ornithomonoglobus sp.]
MTAIEKLISIADSEVGYLEKKSNAQLDDKTANAGTANYTKYWRDIKPEYQGQPWCGCFVTWCFEKAFGKENAKQLLKHYPYVYCPTMASLFKLNANPKKGDIVIFYRNGTFAHTGIVISVSGDYFTTIEGNTSGGSSIIANGGGVCRKGYYNSKLPGTKFCTPEYRLIESEDELMSKEYEELKAYIAEIKIAVDKSNSKMVYNYVDENMPDWARPTIQKMMDKGYLQGYENGKFGLTDEMLRVFVINDRAGIYGG